MLKYTLLRETRQGYLFNLNHLLISFNQCYMSELILTDQNFDQEVLKSNVPVLVDFWAPWCGPCQMMGPIVEEIGKEISDTKVKIGKLNVDENQVIAGKYQVMSIPTFLLFKGGEVIDQMIGGVPKEKLKGMVEKHM